MICDGRERIRLQTKCDILSLADSSYSHPEQWNRQQERNSPAQFDSQAICRQSDGSHQLNMFSSLSCFFFLCFSEDLSHKTEQFYTKCLKYKKEKHSKDGTLTKNDDSTFLETITQVEPSTS